MRFGNFSSLRVQFCVHENVEHAGLFVMVQCHKMIHKKGQKQYRIHIMKRTQNEGNNLGHINIQTSTILLHRELYDKSDMKLVIVR